MATDDRYDFEIAIGIEEIWRLDTSKLDVYRLSIGYVAWVYEMAAMLLSRLGGRGYQVREDQAAYSVDFDPEERKSQQTDALDAHSSRQ